MLLLLISADAAKFSLQKSLMAPVSRFESFPEWQNNVSELVMVEDNVTGHTK
jgi:hypothetical protein